MKTCRTCVGRTNLEYCGHALCVAYSRYREVKCPLCGAPVNDPKNAHCSDKCRERDAEIETAEAAMDAQRHGDRV